MIYFRALLIFFVVAVSCKGKTKSSPVTEDRLKSTMQAYFYNPINNDSANAKYHVLSVNYHEEENEYVCKFKVNLKGKLFDTTGVMTANISKDFKRIERFY